MHTLTITITKSVFSETIINIMPYLSWHYSICQTAHNFLRIWAIDKADQHVEDPCLVPVLGWTIPLLIHLQHCAKLGGAWPHLIHTVQPRVILPWSILAQRILRRYVAPAALCRLYGGQFSQNLSNCVTLEQNCLRHPDLNYTTSKL